MENLIVNLISNEALQELKEMERKHKIQILNEDELKSIKLQKEKLLQEIDNYTYNSILKNLKDSTS